MDETISNHYDHQYFEWQKKIGEFGGWANLTKFLDGICEDHDVLDFGCGGGYLLKNINCRRKIGIEVNPDAANTASANGIEVFKLVTDVPDDYVDVIISNNALEHTLQPLNELKALHSKLRNGGKIVFVVPCEFISYRYHPNDINHHLYSWSPMCLGNLFTEAGYSIIEVKPYVHKWPGPLSSYIAKIGGRGAFEAACRVTGLLTLMGLTFWGPWLQVRIIAEKLID
jgi:SAM-dependent methyltransferase